MSTRFLSSGRESKYVLQSGDVYYLEPKHIDLDVEQFTKLISAKDVPHETRIQQLQQAEKLYRGDLLMEYPYEAFLEPIREKLRHMYIQALHELALYHWDSRAYSVGMEYFERILLTDPFAEPIYYHYITLLLQSGFVKNAKNIAHKMEKYLAEELGISISVKLQQIFHEYGIG